MKRALPLFVPSLTGCVLVASLVFGCPDVYGALEGVTADGHPLATAGTTTPAPLPGANRPGVLVRQAMARATDRQRGTL